MWRINNYPNNLTTGLFLVAALHFSIAPIRASEEHTVTVRWIELPVDRSEIVSQQPDSIDCGYAAMLNCLSIANANTRKIAHSLGAGQNERIKVLADKYGTKESNEDGFGTRQKEDGFKPNDLRDSYNEFRLEHGLTKLSGYYLERGKNETQEQLLIRVHKLLRRSLSLNEPPIIELMSNVASWNPTFFGLIYALLSGANPMEKECIWNNILGHYVTVVGVPEAVNSDGSFCLDYLDSQTGKKERLFLYNDPRGFSGYQNSRFGRGPAKGMRYVCASGSSLDLKTSKQTWSERTEIFATYAIFKE